jgi:pimeloyl-ACP methyl ester carboxylesterase
VRPVLVGHRRGGSVVLDVAALGAVNPCLRTGQTVGAGHFLQLQAPEQVNAMIERFLLLNRW